MPARVRAPARRSAVRPWFFPSLLVALAVAPACAGPPVIVDRPGLVMTTDSGLKIETLRPGTGEVARAGSLVRVHYVGRLQGGGVFDSSREKGGPFEFQIGRRQVIRGWDEGVRGMQVGALRRLTVPPALGYGSSGLANVVPPDATLIFEVELLEIL